MGQLDAFLSRIRPRSEYRGKIMPRNAGAVAVENQLDFRYALTRPDGGKDEGRSSRSDVFNLLNLLNKDWGWQYDGRVPGLRAA